MIVSLFLFILFKYSLIENFNNVPLLKLFLFAPSLCIPIIFLLDNLIIGEPDEPSFVLQLCIILYLSCILLNIP